MTYNEWLDDRNEERASRAFADARDIDLQNADQDAEKAIRALEVAEEHVGARYGGMPDTVQHIATLLVAARILWRPSGR